MNVCLTNPRRDKFGEENNKYVLVRILAGVYARVQNCMKLNGAQRGRLIVFVPP